MDKTQALKFLKRAGVTLSVRTLQREVERGRLAVAYVPGPKGEQADFDEDELKRFADDRKTATLRGRVTPDTGTVAADISQALAVRPQPETLERLFAAMQQAAGRDHLLPVVALSDKLRLTIPEAAAYAGLSKAEIERAVKAGKLKAEAKGARGARVIRRADLEAFERKL